MRSSVYQVCLVALMSKLVWISPAAGQEREATVAGIARDSSKSPLQGALVRLDPGGKRAVTDNQGQFRITDVDPGDYTLSVSYVGLASFTQSLKVDAGA